MSNAWIGIDEDPAVDKRLGADKRTLSVDGSDTEVHVSQVVIVDGDVDRKLKVDAQGSLVPKRGITGSNGTVNVTTSNTAILAQDAARSRAVAWLTNNGSAKVWIAIGAAAVVGQGIPLDVGSTAVISHAASAALNAISTSGTNAVAYAVESD